MSGDGVVVSDDGVAVIDDAAAAAAERGRWWRHARVRGCGEYKEIAGAASSNIPGWRLEKGARLRNDLAEGQLKEGKIEIEISN